MKLNPKLLDECEAALRELAQRDAVIGSRCTNREIAEAVLRVALTWEPAKDKA